MDTVVSRELLLDFFLTFSRFEFALKTSGFHKRHPENSLKPPNAEPDWDSYAVSLRESFAIDSTKDSSFQESCNFILDSPPNRQVIINSAIAWETPVKAENEADVEFILRMIRRIRNNLFHGGKHNIDVHETCERTERLLSASLVILSHCLSISPDLQVAFNEAHL